MVVQTVGMHDGTDAAVPSASSEEVHPLRQFLSAARRQAWLVLVAIVATVVIALVLHARQPVVYRSSMSMVVGTEGTVLRPPELGGSQLTQTVRSLFESDVVARHVIDNLDLDMTTTELLDDLNVKILPQSSVVTANYDSSDAELGLRVLQELSAIFNDVVEQRLLVNVPVVVDPGAAAADAAGAPPTSGPVALSPELQRLSPLVFVRVFDPPHREPEPVSPTALRTGLFAAGVGLAIGLLVAVAREKLDTRLRERSDIERWLGVPASATLKARSIRDPFALLPSPNRPAPQTPPGLAFLAANISTVYAPEPGSVIVVTASSDDEMKTEVAMCLAIVLTQSGHDVVCVDASAGMQLTRNMTAETIPGPFVRVGAPDIEHQLADVVVPRTNRARAAASVGTNQVGGFAPPVMTAEQLDGARAGRLRMLMQPEHDVPLFSERHLVEQVTRVAPLVDYVVVDAAPLPSGQSLRFAALADHLLVVAKALEINRDDALEMRRLLERIGPASASVAFVKRR